MGLQTKLVISFISLLSCLTVMTTGVYAILYSSSYFTINNVTLGIRGSTGKVYGYRYGAKGPEYKGVLLYDEGEMVCTEEMYDSFFANTSFGTFTRRMEYIFQFVVEEEDEAQTLVSLEEHHLTDTDIYVDQYQYLYQKKEPTPAEWNNAPAIYEGDFAEPMLVDFGQTLWVRAYLKTRIAPENFTINMSFPAEWKCVFYVTGFGETTV